MAYEVLARKWRPRQFADVVGQEHVTQTLINALKSQRVAHAYVFVGPRGIGKTSIARIFAKALNCRNGITETPCDQCPSCLEITAGNSLDVMEIDGASNRGIDEIRELRDGVKYVPSGRFKIIIIDEVHMLTTEAFNALLKTLEEPPPHIKFLLATTEPQKIPLTILSRCQRFDLRRIPIRAIMDRLASISQAEHIVVDEDALLAIARASEGGLRDAESALDQLIAFRGGEIRENDVLTVFGLVSRQVLGELADAVLKGDIARVIGWVEELDRNGKDMQRLLLELLEQFRNLLIFMQVGERGVDRDVVGSQLDVIKAHAGTAHPDRILTLTDILVETMDRLRYALSKKTLVETALIRCCRASTTVSLDEIIRQVSQLKGMLGKQSQNGNETPVVESADGRASERENRPPAAQKSAPKKPEEAASASIVSDERALLEAEWAHIVEKVGRISLAKGCLVDARPASVRDNVVMIGFDPEFADQMEQARLPRNHQAIQKVLSDVLKRGVTVECVMLKPQPQETPAPPSEQQHKHGSTAPKTAPSSKPAGPVSYHQKQKWLSNEAVQRTLEVFNGTIVDVRELEKNK